MNTQRNYTANVKKCRNFKNEAVQPSSNSATKLVAIPAKRKAKKQGKFTEAVKLLGVLFLIKLIDRIFPQAN